MLDCVQHVQFPPSRSTAHQSTASNRSRCGSVRGRPALSTHFYPGAAWPIGQRRACTSLGVAFLAFTLLMMRQRAQGNWSNLHSQAVMSLLIAFSSQATTIIRRGFPAISAVGVLGPLLHRVSFCSPACTG